MSTARRNITKQTLIQASMPIIKTAMLLNQFNAVFLWFHEKGEHTNLLL